MANARRPIAPVRKLVAAVLGTVAVFVSLFGLGMTSWSIVALGVALLVLAVALVVVRGGGRTWVNGVAHVHSASEPPTAYAFGRCELQIVIDAPGLPPRSKKIIEPRVPVSKWPDVGQTLPIKVAIDDQRHVRILWDEVPTHAEAAETGDLPPEFDDLAGLDDEALIEQDAPPWAQRRADDDFPAPPGDPVTTADLSDELSGLREDPVVVRHTPGGTIVLEGTLVEPPTRAPLPRRPQPSPGTPRREPARAAAEPTASATTPTTGTPTTDAPTTGATAGTSSPTTAATAGTNSATTGATAGTSSATADAADDIDLDIDGPGHRDEPVTADAPDEALLAGLVDAPAGGSARAAGPIHGVGITLLVTDLDRSVAFYRDMLGFFEIDGGEGNAVLASNSTRLVLRAIPDVAPINRRLVHLNLEVSDVEAVYQELKAKGVRFTYAPRAVNRGAKLELWAAAFRDPDGHGIALTQWRDRPAA